MAGNIEQEPQGCSRLIKDILASNFPALYWIGRTVKVEVDRALDPLRHPYILEQSVGGVDYKMIVTSKQEGWRVKNPEKLLEDY